MREILTLGPDSAHVPLQTVKTYRKGERIICKDDVGTSVVCYLLPLQCACLIPIALVSSLIKEHVFLLRVRCGVQYFVDVGRVQAVLSNRVLSEMTSGACFGEMAFVMSCKKVLRMHGFQADMAIRACDCKAVDVVRVVSLPLSLSFLPPNTLPPSLPHSRTHALPPPLPHSFTPSLLHSLPQTVSHLHALTLSLTHTLKQVELTMRDFLSVLQTHEKSELLDALLRFPSSARAAISVFFSKCFDEFRNRETPVDR